MYSVRLDCYQHINGRMMTCKVTKTHFYTERKPNDKTKHICQVSRTLQIFAAGESSYLKC